MFDNSFSGLRLDERLGKAAQGVTTHFFLGLMAWRQRQHLARLDASRLDDLGLSREEADAEANRPFWDVPRHWLRK